ALLPGLLERGAVVGPGPNGGGARHLRALGPAEMRAGGAAVRRCRCARARAAVDRRDVRLLLLQCGALHPHPAHHDRLGRLQARHARRAGRALHDPLRTPAMTAQKIPTLEPGKAPSLEAINMTKRFGAMTALDNVSINIPAGSFHALLGENGAGKSTLVKCIMGFYSADEGTVLLNGKEIDISNPKDARANGIGMVYQHFTLVPSLTAAENLVINRADTPAIISWGAEKRRLEEFLDKMPFRVPLDAPVSALAAGEKQKLEILKLLYLDQRFMILDEP